MKTVVVTGGAGFLGSHLCEYLLKKGEKVICIDNFFTGTCEILLLNTGFTSGTWARRVLSIHTINKN